MRKRPNFFGRLLLKTGGISMGDEAFWSTWTPQGAISATGTSEMQKAVGDGTGLDIIMAPVLWIARRMAESPVGVNIEDDPEIHFDHDVARLLKSPNPWYAGSTMRMALAVNYLMDGNAYLRKIRDSRDKPVALVFIPSWCIQPMIPPLGQGYIEYYQYNAGGLTAADQSKAMLIPVRDIVHLRYGIDPNFTRKGIAPLKILLREIYTDVQGSTMTAMILKNVGIMGVIISPKNDVSVAKPTETVKYIEEGFKGLRMGKPMAFTTPTDVQWLGAEAEKMNLGVLRAIPEARVCSMLNIPAAIVGFGEGMKQTKVGATLMELRAMAYEDCIIPTQNSWCDELDLQLMPDFEQDPENFSCQFDNSKVRVLQPDDNAISTRLMAQLNGGGIMLSEFREASGMEVKPEHEVFYIPNTVTVVKADNLIPPEPPPPVVPAPANSAIPGQQQNAADGQPTAEQGGKGTKSALHGPARMTPKLSRLQHKLMRNEASAIKEWEPKLAGAFKAYGKKVADKFESVVDRRQKSFTGNNHKAEPDWSLIASEAVGLTWAERDIADLAHSYGDQYLKVAQMTWDALDTELNLGVMMDDYMQSAILKTSGRRLGLIDLEQETKDAMFKAIEEARAEGLGASEMASIIADMVSAGPWLTPEIRAQVIARTETKYAQNYSSLEAYRASENVSDVLVFDAQLGPTDAECTALDQTTVSLSEAMDLMESEHPNGTRSFAPIVGGEGKANGNGHAAIIIHNHLPPAAEVKAGDVHLEAQIIMPEKSQTLKHFTMKKEADGRLVGTIVGGAE